MLAKFPYLRSLLLLCLSFISISVFAQSKVSGTVKGPDGKPMAGATVTVKGTTVSTATNDAGSFTLEVPRGHTVLVISSPAI